MINKTSMKDSYPTLDVSRWFSEELHIGEINSLFRGPDCFMYAGHESIIPNNNDFWVSPQLDKRWILVNKNEEIELVSNVCLHRQAPIVEGKGNQSFFTCKVHCWNYTNKGKLRTAPMFTDVEGQLETKKLERWNGLLFKGKAPSLSLKEFGVDDLIDFSKFHYAYTESTEYDFNWKSFSEVYLENYHIFAIHPGFNGYVDCTNQTWEGNSEGSVQKVGMKETLDQFAGSKDFENYQNSLLKTFEGRMPRLGAVWLYLYPNIMIDWYPGLIVISTIHPISAQKCVNHVDFFFENEAWEKNPEYFTYTKSVYDEVAKEDEWASWYQDQGRKSLFLNGETQSGPIEKNQETGLTFFYDWINKNHPIK